MESHFWLSCFQRCIVSRIMGYRVLVCPRDDHPVAIGGNLFLSRSCPVIVHLVCCTSGGWVFQSISNVSRVFSFGSTCHNHRLEKLPISWMSSSELRTIMEIRYICFSFISTRTSLWYTSGWEDEESILYCLLIMSVRPTCSEHCWHHC